MGLGEKMVTVSQSATSQKLHEAGVSRPSVVDTLRLNAWEAAKLCTPSHVHLVITHLYWQLLLLSPATSAV